MLRGLLLLALSLALSASVACNNSMTQSPANSSNPNGGGNGGSGNSGAGNGGGSGGSGGGGGSQDAGSAGSSAYVYVSGAAGANGNQISAFAADATGRLTEISGSPFSGNDDSMAVNGTHLYAINAAAANIDAYAIGSGGALTFQASTNYQQSSNGCGSAAWLFPDRSGADVYTMEFDGDCANNFYQSFSAASADGSLAYLGTVNGGAGSFNGISLPATFLGNNAFAYEATNNSCMYYSVSAFARSSGGLLTAANSATTLPAPPAGYRIYIPEFAAADAQNHVAIAMVAANPPGCEQGVFPQIGSFTADSNGNLTTTNTSATMPAMAVSAVNDLKISPAGDLIAVGGPEGLQIFHFNGANPITPYTGIVTVDPVSQMSWDNQGNLYVLSQQAGRLHVFTTASGSVHEAPGSPYPINQPNSLAVSPL